MRITLSRRRFLLATAGAGVATLASGCPAPHVAPFGHRSSYGTQIIKPKHWNTVFQCVDAALQQVREQKVPPPPQAAYNYGMATAAGFLTANGIVQAYGEPFGVGAGPQEANPEVAYGVAFAEAAAEVFQQPFLVERIAFLSRFPNNEAKSLGVQ